MIRVIIKVGSWVRKHKVLEPDSVEWITTNIVYDESVWLN